MASATVLELRMEKATFFKNVPEVLSDLFSMAYFDFSSTGLELQAMDDSGSAYVVLQLRSEAFDRYICNNDDLSVSLGLNLAAMAKAFSFANNDDIVTIEYESYGLSFPISLESPDGGVIRCFFLDFVDVHGVPFDISEYPESYEAIVRMPSAKFMHFCNKLTSFWDTGDRKAVVSISVDKDNVRFFTDKSSTIVRQQTQNDDKPNEATRIEMKEKISLTFALRYLNSFSKASTLSDQVTIKLSSNLPAVFEYKIAEMGYIRYYMMPADKEAETVRPFPLPPSHSAALPSQTPPRTRTDPPSSPALLPLRRRPRAMASATVLELRMKKATFLKNVPEVLSDLFSMAYFEFSSTGLELQAMDNSGSAYVVLQLRSGAFDRYICNNDDLSVGLDLADMANAFSFANNDDIVTINYLNGGKAVTISLESPDGGVISDFMADFVGINGKPLNISEYPESLYEAIVRMPSAKFMHFCNKLSSLWDTGDRKVVVSISVDKDWVHFFTDGILGSSTIVCLRTQNDGKPNEAIRIEMKEKISQTFALRYLNSFSKASTLSDQVTIKLSSNLPAVFEYKIAEMGYIRYYVMTADKEAETEGIAEEDKMQN